jgi:hypothetical protein
VTAELEEVVVPADLADLEQIAPDASVSPRGAS